MMSEGNTDDSDILYTEVVDEVYRIVQVPE